MRKTKITFVLPIALNKEFRAKVIADDYGMRGKSIWVVEAIDALFKLTNYPDLVYLNCEMTGFEFAETVVMPWEVKLKVDEAIIEIRKVYPLLEGIQSKIIRTAIVQRLLRTP